MRPDYCRHRRRAAAALRLTLASAPSAARTYTINRVTGPCPEAATTCWTENGLTWNNLPAVAAAATSTLALTPTSATNLYHVRRHGRRRRHGGRHRVELRLAGRRLRRNNASSVIATFKSKDALLNAAGAPQLVIAYAP